MNDKTAIEKAREALKEIAETFPSSIGMNGDAFSNSPEWLKMRNNHMIIAQEALAALDAEKPANDEEVYLCTRPKQDCHARRNGLCLNALRCLPLPEAPIV